MSSQAPWADASTSIQTLAEALGAFNDARDWRRFHTPKDLAMALSIEAGEVLEKFLWRDETGCGDDGPLDPAEIGEELGDVMICLVNLAQRLDIDLMLVTQKKMTLNGLRYPVEEAKGRATKYDKLATALKE